MGDEPADPSGGDPDVAGTGGARQGPGPLLRDPAPPATAAKGRRRWAPFVLAALVLSIAGGTVLVQSVRARQVSVCAGIGLGGSPPAATPEAELQVFLATSGDRLLPPAGPPDTSAWHRTSTCTRGGEVGFELEGPRPPGVRVRIVVMEQGGDGQWSVVGGYV